MKTQPLFMSYSDTFLKVKSVSANYTALTSDEVILVTTGSTANVTISLPTAVGRKGKVYHIKKVDSGTKYAVIDPYSTQTIDGATTNELKTQYASVTIVSDGSNWLVID